MSLAIELWHSVSCCRAGSGGGPSCCSGWSQDSKKERAKAEVRKEKQQNGKREKCHIQQTCSRARGSFVNLPPVAATSMCLANCSMQETVFQHNCMRDFLASCKENRKHGRTWGEERCAVVVQCLGRRLANRSWHQQSLEAKSNRLRFQGEGAMLSVLFCAWRRL